MRAFYRLAALVACCLMISCIDGREEIWIEADGSGRAEVAFSLPAAAALMKGGEEGVREMVGGFLEKGSGLKSSSYEVTKIEDRLHVRVKVSFDSVLDLKEMSAGGGLTELPASAAAMAGVVKLETHGRTLDFSRTISPGKALPGAAFMPASQFQGRRLIYIFHLPVIAKKSNATRTEDGGKTLIWDFPLAEAIEKPVVTRFTADIPIPWWVWVAGGVVLAVIAWVVFWIFRRLRGNENRG